MREEIELIGSKIVSVGYSYGSLVEIGIEQPDGTSTKIAKIGSSEWISMTVIEGDGKHAI